jgi:hypothetical protein
MLKDIDMDNSENDSFFMNYIKVLGHDLRTKCQGSLGQTSGIFGV